MFILTSVIFTYITFKYRCERKKNYTILISGVLEKNCLEVLHPQVFFVELVHNASLIVYCIICTV
jgi:hypothetical protein